MAIALPDWDMTPFTIGQTFKHETLFTDWQVSSLKCLPRLCRFSLHRPLIALTDKRAGRLR